MQSFRGIQIQHQCIQVYHYHYSGQQPNITQYCPIVFKESNYLSYIGNTFLSLGQEYLPYFENTQSSHLWRRMFAKLFPRDCYQKCSVAPIARWEPDCMHVVRRWGDQYQAISNAWWIACMVWKISVPTKVEHMYLLQSLCKRERNGGAMGCLMHIPIGDKYGREAHGFELGEIPSSTVPWVP